MATGGSKPGTTARIKILATGENTVLVEMAKDDVSYFKVGNEYVAFFLAAPPEHPAGGSGEQGNA